MTTAREDIERGEFARALTENKVLNGALDKLTNQAIDRWRNSPWTSEEERREAYHMIRAVDGLRAELKRLIANGDTARKLEQ